MPITPCGYAVGTGIFTPAEIHQMQTSITETIDRLAHGFLTPYATSCPELPLASAWSASRSTTAPTRSRSSMVSLPIRTRTHVLPAWPSIHG